MFRALTRALAALVATGCMLLDPRAAAAAWRPADVHAATGGPGDAVNVCAAGRFDARYAARRERWTYVNGERRLPVRVAVRGDDFRTTVRLGAADYAAGRSDGVRWRADANGIAHATRSDEQGDAVDRVPQSVFPLAPADCRLAGESNRFGPAWVVVDRPPGDRPHWFYVAKASGDVEHEITREGARTTVTAFDRFETVGGVRRPRHWRVSDGNAANDLDVTVDAIEPDAVSELDVAIPQSRRTFAVPNDAGRTVVLPAHFRGRTIFVDVGVDGQPAEFVLDTGTASVILDRRIAERRGWGPVLEHARVPHLTVGPLALADASTLAVPLDIGYSLAGILGFDFFAGHVVHVDYERRRVEVLDEPAAQRAFADPRTFVMPATFDEGIPLVHASFGAAAGDRFALDSGSPQLFVFAPFEQRFQSEIAAHWSPAVFRSGRAVSEPRYLEGSVAMAARRVAGFTLGPLRFTDVVVGLERSNAAADAMDVDLDGIIGTDEMRFFEWWFDYDGGRIGVRRNNER